MKILLVDDEVELTAPLSRLLRGEGHQVDVAQDGDGGLAMATSGAYDLLILDWMLPGLSGVEVCGRLRSQHLATPVLLLTAKDTLDDRVAGLDAGADDYLVKPFHAQELIAKVKGNVARLQRLQDSLQPLPPEPVVTKDALPEALSGAELKVFWQVIQGFTNKEIANHLFLSPRTVQTHLSNILAKLGLKNRSQLVKYAFENGYTAPEYAQG